MVDCRYGAAVHWDLEPEEVAEGHLEERIHSITTLPNRPAVVVIIDEADADLNEPRVGYALAQMALGEDALALSVVLDGLARQVLAD